MKKRFRQIHILVAFLLVIAASCRTGKNYQRPTVLLPGQFDQTAAATDTGSIADINWKDYFSDPVLRRLIDSGISRNHDLQYALTNISIAHAQVRQTQWLWYPQLSLGLSGTYSRNADNGPLG